LAFLCAIHSAHAIILFGTADADANTTAPTGELAGSGWDFQGIWGQVQGTAIGPHHFITATHVGGQVGEVFTYRGVQYTTISRTIDSGSDLQIFEVAGTFPAWAELYDGPNEAGLDLVVFGRGVTRGPEVRVSGALKGWQWGAWDLRLRWGRNRVTSLASHINYPTSDSVMMMVNFDANAGADEGHLGYGDSGGGVFIKQGATWRLAGINHAVDGPYNTTVLGAGFHAAIFDEGGLYKGGEGKWVLTPDLPTSQAGRFSATRIKARLAWIQSVLAAPSTPTLVHAPAVNGPYSPVTNANIDTVAKTIRFVPPAGTQFYQIQNIAARITSTALEGETMVLRYE
jgi:hypothetical protein